MMLVQSGVKHTMRKGREKGLDNIYNSLRYRIAFQHLLYLQAKSIRSGFQVSQVSPVWDSEVQSYLKEEGSF